MRWMRRSLYFLIIAALIISLSPAQVAQAEPVTPQTAEIATPFVPGEVLIGFDGDVPTREYAPRAFALADKLGAQVTRQYSNMAVLSFAPDADVNALAQQMLDTGQVQFAQPNYLYWTPEREEDILGSATTAEGYSMPGEVSDISFSMEELSAMRTEVKGAAYPTFPAELTSGRLWGWDAVQADLIWNNPTVQTQVCLLDTGVDFGHPDLAGKVINQFDYYNGDTLSFDDSGHGTAVAGVITARLNNNVPNRLTGSTTETAAGVSNALVWAVKVLNDQARGTSFSVASGVIHCANMPGAGVINMSFGTTANDPLIYRALRYAVTTRHKAIVAAAGNGTSSDLFYPAAYADPLNPPPSNGVNGISVNVISVAAARAPQNEGVQVWIDADGGNDYDPDEFYAPQKCASGEVMPDGQVFGTNFGRWVSVVAPGESIYTTTPVNYPFRMNFYGNVQTGYDYLSGSSLSAGFVSGAVARLWFSLTDPLQRADPAQYMKERIVGGGDQLTFAIDGNLAAPAQGYANPVGRNDIDGNPVVFGQPYARTTSGVIDTIAAPYCWPGWSSPTPPTGWNESQNMYTTANGRMRTAYLNVAKALKRGAIIAEVKSAQTGLTLPNISVAAYEITTNINPYTYPLRDIARTVGTNSRVILINLPVLDAGTKYELRVLGGGYTAGWQTYNTGIRVFPGTVNQDRYNTISLAPIGNLNFVLDWSNPAANLDMYLWLPKNVSGLYPSNENDNYTQSGGIIGPNGMATLTDYHPGYDQAYIGGGTLQPPNKFIPYAPGINFNLYFAPYAEHIFDGGVAEGRDGLQQPLSPVEWITVLRGAYGGTQYRYPTTANPAGIGPALNNGAVFRPRYIYPAGEIDIDKVYYQLWVTDYSGDTTGTSYGGYLQQDCGLSTPCRYLKTDSPDFVYPVVRVWSNGVLLREIKPQNDAGCNGSNDWWQVLNMRGDMPLWTGASNMDLNACSSLSSTPLPYGNP